MVSPFCDGPHLQSPAASGLLWASSPALLSFTPNAGGLTRPYSSPECTPQQVGSLLFPGQQLFPPSRSPLPRLNWADPELLWDHLKRQDSQHLAPETDLRRRHPGITATMRSILLDWMLEASCNSLPPLPSLLHRCCCTFPPSGLRGVPVAQRDLLPGCEPVRPLPRLTVLHTKGGTSKDWNHLSICSCKD